MSSRPAPSVIGRGAPDLDLSPEELRAIVEPSLACIGPGARVLALGQIYDHRWNSPEELVTIGELSAARVRELTGGLINEAIKVNLNRLLAPGHYDTVLVVERAGRDLYLVEPH